MGVQESFNQSPPLPDLDLFGCDAPLRDSALANGAGGESLVLAAFGRRWGAAEMVEYARLANENPPRLQAFDARGFRRDVVDYHPAYHFLMKESLGASLHCSTWTPAGKPSGAPAEVLRAARLYMVAQIEHGHLCPIMLTRAAVAPLARAAAPAGEMIRKVVSRHYDPDFRPWDEKFGVTIGMGMTERQGGSDLRAIGTSAVAVADGYALSGQKWFMSAPMSDAFLVLAQTVVGPTAFLVPRFRPDGSVNALQYSRLKDKLGNRSNASVEVDFRDAFGWMVGEEGQGVGAMMEMVHRTRGDCAVTSAGLMRAALVHALHHARHRIAFGNRLADQTMMRGVLADIALEVEAAVALVLRLARSLDQAPENEREQARARLLTPACKFYVAKMAPVLITEAMECLGGNGFIEEGAMPRLYREAPINAIWEGAGNVLCLDVLRMAGKDRETVLAVVDEVAAEAGDLPGVSGAADFVRAALGRPDAESSGRAVVERLAMLAAAGALREQQAQSAETFARTRLAGTGTRTFGSCELPGAEIDRLLKRALPG